MALRKTRFSTMGKSSVDIRSAFETKEERKERLPLHASVYPYHQSQLGLSRVKVFPDILKDPMLTQAEYYKTKKPHVHIQQASLRAKTSDLFQKTSFPGQNRNPQAPKLKNELNIETKADKYHVSKEIEHKKAELETQLVHIQPKATLEDKVDLKKVADIRRTIRRRYANRNDFRKIFNQWDENSIGVLTPEDIYKMVNRIGISINLNEAKVLVASVNRSNTGALNLHEFMGLIFDQDDRINVDLATLAGEGDKDANILDLHNLAVNNRTKLLQSELKTFLKDRIYGLAPQFTRKDKQKSGKVSFEEFSKILHNMDIPYSLSSEQTWNLLYKELADEKGLNYQDFLRSIEEFVPIEKEKALEVKETTWQSTAKEPEEIEIYDPLKNLNILNRQKVPVSQLENYFLKTQKPQPLMSEVSKSEKNLKQEPLEKQVENHKPSLDFLVAQRENLLKFSNIQENLISEFRPNDKIIKFEASTRYGAKPSHQNTFLHYHMPLSSSLSQESLPAKKFLPFNLGAEEKAKKFQMEEKKIQTLQRGREKLAERIQESEYVEMWKDHQRLSHRAISKDNYEKRCKMMSLFANIPIE